MAGLDCDPNPIMNDDVTPGRRYTAIQTFNIRRLYDQANRDALSAELCC